MRALIFFVTGKPTAAHQPIRHSISKEKQGAGPTIHKSVRAGRTTAHFNLSARLCQGMSSLATKKRERISVCRADLCDPCHTQPRREGPLAPPMKTQLHREFPGDAKPPAARPLQYKKAQPPCKNKLVVWAFPGGMGKRTRLPVLSRSGPFLLTVFRLGPHWKDCTQLINYARQNRKRPINLLIPRELRQTKPNRPMRNPIIDPHPLQHM